MTTQFQIIQTNQKQLKYAKPSNPEKKEKRKTSHHQIVKFQNKNECGETSLLNWTNNKEKTISCPMMSQKRDSLRTLLKIRTWSKVTKQPSIRILRSSVIIRTKITIWTMYHMTSSVWLKFQTLQTDTTKSPKLVFFLNQKSSYSRTTSCSNQSSK